MFALLAFAAISAAPSQNQQGAMKAWTTCLTTYIIPRLPKEKTVAIVDGGLAACLPQERKLHQTYVREMGSSGNVMFDGVRAGARQHLLSMVATGKAQRGYQ